MRTPLRVQKQRARSVQASLVSGALVLVCVFERMPRSFKGHSGRHPGHAAYIVPPSWKPPARRCPMKSVVSRS